MLDLSTAFDTDDTICSSFVMEVYVTLASNMYRVVLSLSLSLSLWVIGTVLNWSEATPQGLVLNEIHMLQNNNDRIHTTL